MAAQINTALGTLIPNLQVVAGMNVNPTPPSIDIFEAEDFVNNFSYGVGNVEMHFIVRARVHTADSTGGQDLLRTMMDPRATTSVALAIFGNDSLGGVVERVYVTEQSGLALFPYPADPENRSLIGATWTVRVLP